MRLEVALLSIPFAFCLSLFALRASIATQSSKGVSLSLRTIAYPFFICKSSLSFFLYILYQKRRDFSNVRLYSRVRVLVASSFPTTLKFYHNVFELLSQQFAFVQPTDLSGGFNLYCGAAILIFVPMFLINKNIRLWDRLVKLFAVVFVLVCLNTNYLTYIWHGFHFPNGLPGRYSFIYIFLLLIMGYEGFKAYKVLFTSYAILTDCFF